MAAALAGTDIALAPTFIYGDEITSGKLYQILKEFEPRPYGIHAICPLSHHVSTKVRAFFDFLVLRFGSAAYWEPRLYGPRLKCRLAGD